MLNLFRPTKKSYLFFVPILILKLYFFLEKAVESHVEAEFAQAEAVESEQHERRQAVGVRHDGALEQQTVDVAEAERLKGRPCA